MWLKLIVTLLPLIPQLANDVQHAVDHFKSTEDGAAKVQAAKTALDDLADLVGTVLHQVSPPANSPQG